MEYPAEVILIRHGQSEANASLSNDPNCSLTTLGLTQARTVGERLRSTWKPTELGGWIGITSPYRRTRQTAAVISDATGLRFEVDDSIREWGVTATVDDTVHPQESIEHVVTRLKAFFDRRHGQRLVIVSHATPIALMTQLLHHEELITTGSFWIGVENCCLRRWPARDSG